MATEIGDVRRYELPHGPTTDEENGTYFFDDEVQEASDDIMNFGQPQDASEWQKVSGVMDSGAAI